jgi:uncharacterized protein (DUF934 family)
MHDKLTSTIPIIQQILASSTSTNKVEYQVSQDNWVLLNTEEAQEYIQNTDLFATATVLLPAAVYIATPQLQQAQQAKHIGVYLNSDEELSLIEPFLAQLPVIAFNFETFRDGRAYSKAYMLKTRLNFQGQIRAVGDVLRDQMAYMARCGFNTFVVRADKNIQDALNAFTEFSRTYQTDVLQNKPNYI